jgi:hypothetical protein
MTAATASSRLRPSSRYYALVPLLLLSILSGCNGGDGLSDYQREENKREQRVSSLRDQGATISTKDYPPYGRGYVVNLSGAQVTPAAFQTLKDLNKQGGRQGIAELDLSKSSIGDDLMDQLNEIAHFLVKLDLSNTAVTDAGLQKLTNLNVCFNLNLAGTQVTPEGVSSFKNERLNRPTTIVKNTNIQLR